MLTGLVRGVVRVDPVSTEDDSGTASAILISSRSYAPGNGALTLTDGVVTTQNAKIAHTNNGGKSVSKVRLVYAGWYIGASSETNGDNDFTVSASIEYPAGTFNQVTFSGATTGTVPSTGLLISDEITLSTPIPDATRFWERCFVSVSSGQKWPKSYSPQASLSEAGEAGSGLADKTMSGTISGTTAVYGSSGIISGESGLRRRAYAIMGDSIAFGSGDGNYDSQGHQGFFGHACTRKNIAALTMSYGGSSAQTSASNNARRIALMKALGITHCLVEFGVNDIASGRSYAQLSADLAAIWQAINNNGIRVIQSTITTKVSATTDAYHTVAGQTVASGGFSGGAASVRGVLNDYIRGNPAPLLGSVELADALEPARYDGRYIAGGGYNSHIEAAVTGAVNGSPTTTVIPVDIALVTNYYQFGGAITFTSGALSGTRALITSNTTTSVTLTTALGSAPAPGDTFSLSSRRVASTSDGLHPNVTDTGGVGFGGHFVMRDVLEAFMDATA